MATTIQRFFSRAAQEQFARDFLFRVKQISVPGVQLNGEDDLVYARSASLPGRDIENKTVFYSGQQFNVPGKSSYPNSESYSIEFYHDEDINLRSKLELASRVVFNNETTTGEYGIPGPESYIILEVIDKQLETVEEIKLVGASIRTVGQIDHSIADGTGEVLTFPVTFSYHFYEDFNNN